MVSHPHHPLPRTKLASLVKGEVLSPEKIRATTGGIAAPPFQNRTIPSPFAMLTSVCADTLSHPHHHSPHTNILASLVKGEVLSPEKIRATTGGIALHPLASPSPQPSQNHIHPRPSPPPLPPLSNVRCCRPKKSGDYRRDCRTTIPKPHYPLAFCNANICMCRYAFASAPSFASHQHPCLPCQREVD